MHAVLKACRHALTRTCPTAWGLKLPAHTLYTPSINTTSTTRTDTNLENKALRLIVNWTPYIPLVLCSKLQLVALLLGEGVWV